MSQALQTLIEQAERERDQAQAGVLQAEDHQQRLQAQRQQLQAYEADYASRAPGFSGQAATIAQLRAHHAFMQRLQQALLQQHAALAQADEQLLQQRQRLLACELRLAAVRKLVERRWQDEQLQAARHEQKRSDEAAAQAHWRQGGQDRRLMP